MLSIPHMIVVFVIVLVVFGPQKLPELARGLGKLMAEFRKASTDFKSAFEEEMRDLERQAREVERRKIADAAATAAAYPQPATFATPSDAQTQPPSTELATETDTRATEALTIQPIGEAVSRSTEPVEAPESAESTDASAPPSSEPRTDDSFASTPPDTIHDHKQPA